MPVSRDYNRFPEPASSSSTRNKLGNRIDDPYSEDTSGPLSAGNPSAFTSAQKIEIESFLELTSKRLQLCIDNAFRHNNRLAMLNDKLFGPEAEEAQGEVDDPNKPIGLLNRIDLAISFLQRLQSMIDNEIDRTQRL